MHRLASQALAAIQHVQFPIGQQTSASVLPLAASYRQYQHALMIHQAMKLTVDL